MKRKKRHSAWYVTKEIALGTLALVSIGIVLYDFFGNPPEKTQSIINRLDFVIACTFLLDFSASLLLAKHKMRYFKRNWYFLLAAIPFTDTLTESLRGLRVLRLVRLVRAGEHLDYGLGKKSNR